MKKLLLIFYLFCLTGAAFAQKTDSDPKEKLQMPVFDAREKLQIERQVRGQVDRFCKRLSDLASSETDKSTKAEYKKLLNSFFIGSAVISTLSKAHPHAGKESLVPVYLNTVANYSERLKYSYVALKYNKVIINLNSLKDTTIDNQPALKGTFSFWQEFIVANKELFTVKDEEVPVFGEINYNASDDTEKAGDFYIIKEKASLQGPRYRILLGSIYAREIKPLKAE